MFRYNHLLTPKKRIAKWITEVINDGSWEKFNDLHIDYIDETHDRNKRKWLTSSIAYLSIAKKILSERHLPYYIELLIELEYKEGNGIYVVNDKTQIQKDLTDTPPSLYLFHKDIKPSSEEYIYRTGIPIKLYSTIIEKSTYIQSFDEENNETNRWIIIT